MAFDVRILANLIGDRTVMADRDDPEPAILELFPNLSVACRLCGLIVMRSVDKDTDPWHGIALVVEIGLGGDVTRRSVLCKMRQRKLLGKQVVEERPLRCGTAFRRAIKAPTPLSARKPS